MKINLKHPTGVMVIVCAMVLADWNAFGLGSDWPDALRADNPSWPKGMTDLVNLTNRIHGFFVNDGDAFFFAGSVTNFTSFLEDYSKINGVVDKHRLILHQGTGETKSPWDKTGRRCDWELWGQGNGWKNGVVTNYILEVHFWTNGKIALDKLNIPKNIEVSKEK